VILNLNPTIDYWRSGVLVLATLVFSKIRAGIFYKSMLIRVSDVAITQFTFHRPAAGLLEGFATMNKM